MEKDRNRKSQESNGTSLNWAGVFVEVVGGGGVGSLGDAESLFVRSLERSPLARTRGWNNHRLLNTYGRGGSFLLLGGVGALPIPGDTSRNWPGERYLPACTTTSEERVGRIEKSVLRKVTSRLLEPCHSVLTVEGSQKKKASF